MEEVTINGDVHTSGGGIDLMSVGPLSLKHEWTEVVTWIVSRQIHSFTIYL